MSFSRTKQNARKTRDVEGEAADLWCAVTSLQSASLDEVKDARGVLMLCREKLNKLIEATA